MDDQQQPKTDNNQPVTTAPDNTDQPKEPFTGISQTPQQTITPKPEEPLIDLPKPKVELPESISDAVTQIDQDTAVKPQETHSEVSISITQTDNTDSQQSSPVAESQSTPEPKVETPKTEPTPATVPAMASAPIVSDYLHTKNKPAVVAIVSIILLVIAAGLSFLYVQNNRLKSQIRTIEDINSQRETTEETTTPTPQQIAVQNDVFTDIKKVIEFAKAESPTAQLLMITSNNLSLTQVPSTYNYWFRTAPSSGEYFQVQAEPGKELTIIKPATVNPDNEIPDLVENANNNTLGITDREVVALGWEKVGSQASEGNKPISISGVYIKSVPSGSVDQKQVNLWQVTYFFAPETGTEDIIIQIDANTKEILFNNKDTQPSATPSEASSS